MNQKRKIGTLLFILLSLVFFQSCEKEDFEHPEVKSISITSLSPVKVKIIGEITHKGKFVISDYGFVYSTSSSVSIENGTKVSFGNEISEGTFSKDVAINLPSNYTRTVYARTYLTNEKGTAYGDVLSVQLPGISSSGLNPTSGKAGDKITIQGSFSSLSKEDVSIFVGNIAAKIESVSPSQVVFEVPSGISTSSYYSNQVPVSINISGQSITVTSYFTLRPTFTDYSPKSATIGSTITLTGNNLSSSALYNSSVKIYFGNAYTTSYSISSTGLTVTIPTSITSEKFQIAIEIDGVKTTLPGEFTISLPTITSLSATTTWPGSSLTINGNNFNNYYNTVSIGDIAASVSTYSSSSTQLYVNIPSNLPEGEHSIKVFSGTTFVTAPIKLKVKSASFSGFSPASGSPGREITLSGDFNPNASYSVYFGSTQYSTTYSSTGTSMKVNVPSSLDAGDVKITIKSGSTSITHADNFTVLAPSITSISPTSGVAGTLVTITGNGFGPNIYNNSVKFGTTATPSIVSATESTLKVLVPSNLTPGAMKISVTNNYGQTVVSPMNFTVTNQ